MRLNVVIASAFVAVFCVSPRDEEKAEWKKLDGPWELVATEMVGQKYECPPPRRKIVFSDQKIYFGSSDYGTVKIDVGTNPKRITFQYFTGDPPQWQQVRGIYKFEKDYFVIRWRVQEPGETDQEAQKKTPNTFDTSQPPFDFEQRVRFYSRTADPLK